MSSTDRYEMRKSQEGAWSVIDRFTGHLVEIEGRTMVGMTLDEADDMVDLINRLDEEKRSASRQ